MTGIGKNISLPATDLGEFFIAENIYEAENQSKGIKRIPTNKKTTLLTVNTSVQIHSS